MDVSIIIVTYNSDKIIKETILSIIKHKTNLIYEILIIDNLSNDDTIKVIEEIKCSNLTIIRNKRNQGFSIANNIAAKKAKGDFLFFINPDIIFKDYVMDEIIDFYTNNKNVGIIAPMLLYQDGSIQESARRFPDMITLLLGRGPIDLSFINKKINKKIDYYLMRDWAHNETKPIDWSIGAALFIKKDYFNYLEGFDESFFLYCEDMDLCYRNKKAGYETYYLHNVSLIHLYQQSSRKKLKLTWIHFISIIKFYYKHKEFIFTRLGK